MYPVSSNIRTITSMNKQFENLQLQLATGKRYNTLAEMGSDRVHDLNLRNRLSRIEGYQSNILTVENRMSFYTNGLERLDEIEASARGLAIPGAYGTDGINFVNARNQATNLLKEVIDVLNTDITGQYIFGGNKSDTKPVASFDTIMTAFSVFVDQYNTDHGVNAQGLVTVGAAGGTVTLTQGAEPDLGIKLASVTSASGAVSATGGAGTHDVSFTDAPQPGDTIKVGYTLPNDPTVRYVTLTAVSSEVDPVPANSFVVGDGADAAARGEATAANFEEAIGKTLTAIAEGELRSATTYMAADDFFNATGEAQHPDATQWYFGQNDGGNPRQTVSANVDEHTKAHYGVQANEKGFVELIKGLAVFAVSDLSPLDSTNAARYEELVSIQRSRLSEENNAQPGSIEGITMELGLAASTVNTVKERHTQYNAQLATMLAEIETAPREEIAMMLLTLQTQLQASYQATSMASQLSLVNYLR
jgi:flagellin-like hook-associated protein FlgL